ncbi:hypothetical protein NPIL_211431 [Nephila pilipes]|uniref:Uncharacterized protein n=1 Tax=Nephila pilipes TaxID=299642 RepID=A0A8X6K2S6_NEPPI|nr:hypothetical protein NPIL_211431 [Nephila pilipes]
MMLRASRIVLTVHFEIPFFAVSDGKRNRPRFTISSPFTSCRKNSSNIPNFATPCVLLICGFFPRPLILLPVGKTPPMRLENPRIFIACVLNSQVSDLRFQLILSCWEVSL